MKNKKNSKKSVNKSKAIDYAPLRILLLTVSAASLAGLPIILDSFTTPKILISCIGICYLSLWILRNRYNELNKFGRFHVSLVYLSVAGLTLSTILSDLPFWRSIFGQFGRGNGYAYYLIAMCLFIFGYKLYKKEYDEKIRTVLLRFSWIIGIYAILQSWGIDFAQLDTTKSRILLTLGNSNFSGGLLSVFFTYNLIIAAKSNSKKIGDWALILILAYSTLLTGAVQGLLIIFISLVIGINILARNNSPKIYKRAVQIQVISTFVITTLALLGKGPLYSLLNRPTLKIRFEYWKIGMQMIRDNPILGVGPDAFYDHSSPYMAPGTIELITYTRLDAAHNWFINIGANFGLITLVPLLILFISIVYQGIKTLFGPDKMSHYYLASQVTFMMLLLDAMVSIEQPGLGIWLYLFAGMCLSMTFKKLNTEKILAPGILKNDKLSIVTFLVLMLFFSSTFFIRIQSDFQLRNQLRHVLSGNIDVNSQTQLANLAIKLQSEPEYASRAVDQLAKLGDSSGLEKVSKAIFEYNSESIQALLIRQEVLRALQREKEACPIVNELIIRIPWDLSLWKKSLLCSTFLDRSNVLRANLTMPYIELKLDTTDKGQPDYLSYLTLAAYSEYMMGNMTSAKSLYREILQTDLRFQSETSEAFIAQLNNSLNSNINILIIKLGGLLNE